MLTARFEDAFLYAAKLHAGQTRKKTGRPYIGHLMGVCALVLQYGGDEEMAIAALLHDGPEDCGGQPVLDGIRRKYGERVAHIVAGCTDTMENPKPLWHPRKEKYIAHVRSADADTRLVSAADKLYNVREILFDCRQHGEKVWERFAGGRDSLWYYRALVDAFRAAGSAPIVEEFDREVTALERLSASAVQAALRQARPHASAERPARAAAFAGWGAVTGARRVAVRDIEREFGLPARKIAKGAGIESVARVTDDEDECVLAMRACEAALGAAGTDIGTVECLIVTSETHIGYPSLGALLHARLLAEPRTAVFDIGGGCLGLVNSLAVAQALITTGTFREILVATSDVHSRMLIPGRVKGEFGALFGDGASAFLLRAADPGGTQSYLLGEVLLGCEPTVASAIRVSLTKTLSLDLVFDGESLSRAALTRLQEIIEDLEMRSGTSRATAAAFATHQPNPRLVGLLARQLGVPPERFPPVARKCGNLGSSTCGVALSQALTECAGRPDSERGPIYVAALGPGLLWGGTVILRERS